MRALLVLLALALLFPAPARAVYQCGAQRDDCRCAGYDPYPCCSNGGNCTWYAWEAACCNWGIALPSWWGNANTWGQNARASGYDIRDCHVPVVGTISNSTRGQYGHVAWVTRLNGGGGVHVQEQNCDYGPGSMDEQNYGVCWFNYGFIARGGQVQCNPGDSQTQGCGGCGVQTRGCGADGRWGGWSGCGGNGGGCTPGQVQQQACGRCGVQTRTCNGSCQWDGWSACSGEGECSPGQTEQHACCDCGQQQRSCNASCHWDGWGACAGPDPAGAPSCETGKPGVCADGRERCVSGCLACVQLNQPSAEVCDDLDNDCNGAVDDGDPQVLSDPPPAFAASVVDASFPRWMAPGSSDEAWIALRNEGSSTWRAGQVSLRADAPASGEESRLAPARGWPAFDTAAVLGEDVAPGQTAVLRFPIEVRDDAADIDETFTLATPEGREMACPEARVAFDIATVGFHGSTGAEPLLRRPSLATQTPADGCANAGAGPLALLALGLLARRGRRKQA